MARKTTAKKARTKSNGQFAVAIRQFRRNKLALVGLCVFIIIILACCLYRVISPYNYEIADIPNRLADLSWEHPLGTDSLGRDLLARILKGGQISLLVSACAIILCAVFSTLLGCSAAFFGGLYENVVMRIMDVLMSIPALLMAAAVSITAGAGLFASVLAIAVSQTASMSRVMYSSALTVRGMESIEAARATGASSLRIIMKYVIPECMAPLIVQISLRLGICICMIASLSFIGLGVKPPMPEWGSILNEGKTYIREYWPIVTFPGIAIALTMISVNLVGDGVRDALDPRLKR